MKKILITCCLFISFTAIISAQQAPLVPPVIRATNFSERLNYQIGAGTTSLLGMPIRAADVIGDTYLFTDWRQSNVMLYDSDKLIENHVIRYDMKDDNIEFKFGNDIRVLKGSRVKSFVCIDSVSKTPTYFMNGKDFVNKDNTPFDGFMQVLSDGSMPLLKRYEIYIKQPDFNLALNVGSIDYKIIKRLQYYYMLDGKLHLLPSGKGAILKVFGEDKEQVKKFMKLNNVQVSEEHHLSAVFDYYNSMKQ
jgi:hypothetical protein